MHSVARVATSPLLRGVSQVDMAKDGLQARVAQQLRDYSAQGIHRTGTAVDWASAEWLVNELKAAGVPDDAVQLREFAFEQLNPGPAFLCLDGSCTLGGLPMFVRMLPILRVLLYFGAFVDRCLNTNSGLRFSYSYSRTVLATQTCLASAA